MRATLLALLIAVPAHAQSSGELVFLSPMGEPFHGTREAPPELAWFDGADADHDGRLTVDEMIADAARFFSRLDPDKSGEIDPIEIDRYENEIAPEVRSREISVRQASDATLDGPDSFSGGPTPPQRYRGERGAALFSYFGFPEPVVAADTNFNRGVSLREFERAAQKRFEMLDANRDNILERGELPPAPSRSAKRKRR